MRLITFGCSLTGGDALPDNQDNQSTSKYSWPQQLANKLNVQVVNRGYSGASSKYVTNELLNYDYHSDDVVITLWPINPRTGIIDVGPDNKITEVHKIRPWYSKTQKISKFYFEYMYSPVNSTFEQYIMISAVQHYLDNKSIMNFHIINAELSAGSEHFDWFDTPMLVSYEELTTYLKDHKAKAPDGIHPGIDAHSDFADLLYKKLKGKI